MRATEFTINTIQESDEFDIELDENTCLSTYVVSIGNDMVVLEADQQAVDMLHSHGLLGVEELTEAEYRGRNVPLGKPMAGDVKKKKVYVKKPNGNIVKVEFGDPNMRIKKSNPKRRKSFRARHNCENPGPRWKARYWSCRAW